VRLDSSKLRIAITLDPRESPRFLKNRFAENFRFPRNYHNRFAPKVVNQNPPVETEKEVVRNSEVTVPFRDRDDAKARAGKRRRFNGLN
jgi:hypothetical protein